MEWEFPAPETREATRSAAITASTLMNLNLRIQHAMTEEMSVCEADAACPRSTPAISCQKHSLPFIVRRERRAMKNGENDAHSIENKDRDPQQNPRCKRVEVRSSLGQFRRDLGNTSVEGERNDQTGSNRLVCFDRAAHKTARQ